MAVITRSDWSAGVNTAGQINLPVRRLFLHHSVTPEWIGALAARRLQEIARDRGFRDISYSWLVDVRGNQIEGRGWGRVGAHTAGHNSTSHGICLVGNFHSKDPPEPMLRGAAHLVEKHDRFGPGRITHGHRDVAPTACPGNRGYAAIDKINRLASSAQPIPPPVEGDDESMKHGDSALHIRSAKQTLVGVLEDYRDENGRPLDQSRTLRSLGWKYDDAMAKLVFYLLVRVLGVEESNASGGRVLHTSQLVEMVRRTYEPR